MIDFTNCPRTNKGYNGANGEKISVIYNGERYMLKFSSVPKINKDMNYTNACISEYIGSHILSMLNLPVQETLLGIYKVNEKDKLVVACKDFAKDGFVIQDFASLKNQIIDYIRKGNGTDIDSILETIDKQTIVDSKILREFFFDTFIADAFVGNWDSHNGNWGFLYNVLDDSIKLAPLWDLGSSLYPGADENIMKSVFEDKNELNKRIYSIPTSAITYEGKRINYFDFLSSGKYKDCTNSLIKITKRIDLEKINNFIDNIEEITSLQKEFYKFMLRQRKEKILDEALKILEEKDMI